MESVKEVKRRKKKNRKGKESRYGNRYGFDLKLRCVKLHLEKGLPVSLLIKEVGASRDTILHWVRAYRERGAAAFFKPPARRQGSRLTPERLAEAQRLLDQGRRVPEISAALGILPSTLHKALDDGRLRGVKKKTPRVGRG